MNIKKYLRQQAENDAKCLLNEEDKLLIQQLIQKEERERQKKAEELSKNKDTTD